MKAGWEVRPIKDVTFIQEGPGIRKYEYQEGGYPIINVRCVQDGFIDMSNSKAANTEIATGKWAHFQIDEGDILFTISGTIGRSAIVKKDDLPLLMNTSVVRFRPTDPGLDRDFLHLFLQSDGFQKPLEKLSSGAAIRNVGPTHIKTMNIPIPPLEEQKRIVEILDAAFEGLDRAKENAEANLQNARELFERQSAEVIFNSKEMLIAPQVVLRDVVSLTGGFAFKSGQYVDEGRFVLRTLNIMKDGTISRDNSKFIAEDTASEFARFELQEFDTLFVMVGATLGKVGYVQPSCLPALLNQNMWVARANPAKITPAFLNCIFKGLTQGLIESAGGTARSFLRRDDVRDLIFGLPSIEDQKSIVERVSVLRNNLESLEAEYTTKLTNIADLRQSLLQKAFAGELT